ncbi:MAG: hypothetical protein NZ473_01995 [Candidatus Kapabacteria bacterium]|nr:hypothetical protein [Candidatus Kapabacteria bacterium]MDW7996988.1 hypothetical protein [Bacteroidota bacterium]MDW8225084.1 hypothetical protein [Bacteroidota bacterium]
MVSVLVAGISLTPLFLWAQLEPSPLAPEIVPPRIFIGPATGYNRSFHTANIASFATQTECPVFERGSANGFFLGVTAEYILGDPKTSRSSVIMRITFDNLPTNFELAGDNYPSRLTATIDGRDTQVVVSTSTQHVAEVSYYTLNAELLYRLDIGGLPVGIVVGPTFGFPIKGTFQQRYELTSPDFVEIAGRRYIPVFARDTADPTLRYTNNDRTIIVRDGDIEERSGFRLGVKAGLQYELTFGRWRLIPGIYYNFGVTKVTSRENWRVNALQMGVDFRTAF